MSEINLLNTDSPSSSQSYDFLTLLLSRLFQALLVMAILLYAGLFIYGWLNNRSLTNVTNKIQAAQASALANKDRNELVTRQEQLAQLETLIDNHVYWSYLLPELARVTLKSAKYSEIEAMSDGKLNLSVNLPTYEDIEKYLQIFDLPEYNAQFSNVRIVSINTVQTDNAIQTQLRLQLTFNPEYIKGRL